HDAIAQGHVAYGMQTFDQSLMSLVKQNLVTYQEALRQATNPDDFALRFQGISSTSDSKWDDFDKKPGDAQPVPGTQAFAQQGAPSAAPAARPVPPPPAKPAAPAPAAKPAAAPAGDDDFQIERF